MGNCLKKSKISAQDHENDDAPVVEENVEKVKVMLSKLEAAEMEEKTKKKVRFMVKNGGTCKSGGVIRIRVVMSQEELKKMLRCKDEALQQSSMEQLLHAVKLRGGRISCDHHERISSWKPSLDSIPEDSSFMNLK